MKNPRAAYSYAVNVIGHRWPEAEPHIMKNPKVWAAYKAGFNIIEKHSG